MLAPTSKARLATTDPKLQELVNKAAEHWPLTVIEGHRSKRRQKQLYLAGRSKLDGETRLSKHNYAPSQAVDIAPLPLDWNDTETFYRFGFYVKGLAASLGINIRWGGDWDGDGDTKDQTFNDLVHFELV